nr:polysaccharide deacetylase family protein [Mycobacterium sp. JS623]
MLLTYSIALLLACTLGAVTVFSVHSEKPDPGRAPGALKNGSTVVSLTFDDAFVSQMNAKELLARHSMHGTFFIPSGFIGSEGRLTLDQIKAIQDAGHEIGGHTVNHLHLPVLDPAEQARQICDDRVALNSEGLNVRSFAYPYAVSDLRTEQIVKDCGYNSARSESGLFRGGACDTCDFAETVPPANPYSIRTSTPVINTTKLASIEREIIDARNHGGGWLPVVFHDVCDGCSSMAISTSDFDALLEWLESQAANGITVATIDQVIGGPAKGVVAGPVDQRPDGQLVNSSLEIPDPNGDPNIRAQCWQRSGYGDNTSTWSRVESAHSGGWAEQVTMGSWESGDQKLIVEEDSGACSPAVKPGQTYTMSAWYKSTAETKFVVFFRNSQGRWKFWTESPQADPSQDWTQFSWQTPPIPDGATRLSFGLQLARVGTLSIDDYGMALDSPT